MGMAVKVWMVTFKAPYGEGQRCIEVLSVDDVIHGFFYDDDAGVVTEPRGHRAKYFVMPHHISRIECAYRGAD